MDLEKEVLDLRDRAGRIESNIRGVRSRIADHDDRLERGDQEFQHLRDGDEALWKRHRELVDTELPAKYAPKDAVEDAAESADKAIRAIGPVRTKAQEAHDLAQAAKAAAEAAAGRIPDCTTCPSRISKDAVTAERQARDRRNALVIQFTMAVFVILTQVGIFVWWLTQGKGGVP